MIIAAVFMYKKEQYMIYGIKQPANDASFEVDCFEVCGANACAYPKSYEAALAQAIRYMKNDGDRAEIIMLLDNGGEIPAAEGMRDGDEIFWEYKKTWDELEKEMAE